MKNRESIIDTIGHKPVAEAAYRLYAYTQRAATACGQENAKPEIRLQAPLWEHEKSQGLHRTDSLFASAFLKPDISSKCFFFKTSSFLVSLILTFFHVPRLQSSG